MKKLDIDKNIGIKELIELIMQLIKKKPQLFSQIIQDSLVSEESE